MADRQDLRALIARHAPPHGTKISALPGLKFSRSERPTTFTSGHTPTLSLAVIAQGKKVCRIGGQDYHYDTDSYLVFTGETEFSSSVLEASARRPYLAMTLHLPTEDVVQSLLKLDGGTARPEPAGAAVSVPMAFASRIEPPLIDALCRLAATLDDPTERQVIAPLVVTELVFRLLRSEAAMMVRHAAGRQSDQNRIAQAMSFMRANLNRRLSVAAIARHVAMSPSHFAHRFREVARTSPMSYLREVRLLAARLSLLNDGDSPTEAASRVGYQSAAHFSRDFKTYFALPPATYARQFRDAAVRAQQGAQQDQTT